jgi:uncharacterized membrane protein YjfL (UPF0719 family)
MALSSLGRATGLSRHFCVSAAVVAGYLYIYTRITPHDESG